MNFKRFLPGIIISFVLVLSVVGYFYLTKKNAPVGEAVQALPDDPVFVLRIEDPASFWKKIKQNSIIWEDMLESGLAWGMDADVSVLDSLFNRDKEIAALYSSAELFLSCYATGKGKTDFLYVFSLPDITLETTLLDFISKNSAKQPVAGKEIQQYKLYSCVVRGNRVFHYTIADGVFISGFNSLLVERALNVFIRKKSSLKNNVIFTQITESTGSKISASLYINYVNLPLMLDGKLSENMQEEISGLKNFASWSGLDVTLRPNEMVLNGFTSPVNNGKSFLGLFTGQKPAEIEIIRITPKNTVSIFFTGFSNFSEFRKKYKEFLRANGKMEKYEQETAKINKHFNADIEKEMLSWVENEVALIRAQLPGKEKRVVSFAVFRSNRMEEARSYLLGLQKKISRVKNKEMDTSSYKGHLVGKISISSLLEKIMGPGFSPVKENYYTLLSDYVVYADSVKYLQSIVDSYLEGNTLFFDQPYKSFAENNLDAEANLFYYRNIPSSLEEMYDGLSGDFRDTVQRYSNLASKFQSAAIQFSYGNDLFYTTLLLKHGPVEKQESGTLWEALLDTSISTAPQLVSNHKTGGKEIVVQDDANTIYLISNTGKIVWKKALDEKIMGLIHQVDALKNEKLQLLFNTKSNIHLIDRNGNYLPGFPLRLESPATAGMALFDYERNRDYRILLPTQDKSICNYDIKGKKTEGWSLDKTAYEVVKQVQHCTVTNKDYIIITDVSGSVYITDRQGRSRIKLKEKFVPPSGEVFLEPGKDENTTRLVCIDSVGNIQKLGFDDKLETFKIEAFDTVPFFDYKDMDNNQQREFIYLDKNNLTVYKSDESLLFTYEFEQDIRQAPFYFNFPDGEGYIGVVSTATNELFLLNNKGSLLEKFPVYGSTPFIIADINNDNHLVLVTAGAKGSVLAYVIK